MSDLFKEKAEGWDKRPMSQIISEGVGQALLDHVEFSSGQRVMDFGAGTGLICATVAPRVQQVVAVDVSAAMLEKLKQKSQLQGKVETVCQDIIEQPLSEQFDLIISAMALHHVEDTDTLLLRFAEHLLPNGTIALADLDREDGSFHPPHVEGVYHDGFEREQLERKLESAGFAEIKFVTVLEINKEERSYPVFLVTAVRR